MLKVAQEFSTSTSANLWLKAIEINRGQFAEYLASKGIKVDRKVLKLWEEP